MKAYCSLLCSDSFLPGVLCLSQSLKQVSAAYPFVLFVTPNLSDDVMQSLDYFDIQYHCIQPVQVQQSQYIFKRFENTWTKLALFDQVLYSRLLYLDADICVLKNMDEVFDIELNGALAMAAACTCNPEKKSMYPDSWRPETCFFNGQRPERDFYGNSGMMLFEPKEGLLDTMKQFLKEKGVESFPFPDQDFLNAFYKDSLIPLSYIYNTLKTCLLHHADSCHLESVKALHYILKKPWEDQGDNSKYKELDALWWDCYDQIQVRD